MIDTLNIAIIGAGIIGSAIACRLSTQGHQVTIFDDAPSEPQATIHSFGWINAHSPENEHHFKLRLESMKLWGELIDANPDIPARPITAIDWDMKLDEIAITQEAYSTLGHQTKILTQPSLKAAFTYLTLDCVEAIVSEMDFVADPNAIGQFFLSSSINAGAKLYNRTRIEGLEVSDGKVTVVHGDDATTFDHVVVAAGLGTANIVETLGASLPMANRQGVLLRSEPVTAKLSALLSAPDFHVWQMADGRLIAGQAENGDTDIEDIAQLKSDLAKRIETAFPAAGKIEFSLHSVATRPEPIDGMPVISEINNHPCITVAMMHSGITLAPLVAELVANKISGADVSDLVAPYSIDRFQMPREAVAI